MARLWPVCVFSYARCNAQLRRPPLYEGRTRHWTQWHGVRSFVIRLAFVRLAQRLDSQEAASRRIPIESRGINATTCEIGLWPSDMNTLSIQSLQVYMSVNFSRPEGAPPLPVACTMSSANALQCSPASLRPL